MGAGEHVTFDVPRIEAHWADGIAGGIAIWKAAEAAVREIVGKSKMDFVLYEGREQIATEAAKLMQEIMDRYSAFKAPCALGA